ncbi:MAG: hypothetical protein WKF82_10635 [Nocardioidaceae bacterium]
MEHQRRPGEVGQNGRLDAPGGTSLQTEQRAHERSRQYQGRIASGDRSQGVNGGGHHYRILLANGGIHRTSEEEFLGDAVRERGDEHERLGALLGKTQNMSESVVEHQECVVRREHIRRKTRRRIRRSGWV